MESLRNHSVKRVANIIGASGLVGQQLLSQLLNNPEFEKVRSFVRRSSGNTHPKLEEIKINFDQPETWKHLVQGDVLFSTLGTTIKTAKTKENQYLVDFTYQYEFAKVGATNGVGAYILVSSMGADSKSSIFYSRIKGELEDAVARLSFQKLIIFQPSILDGDRKENRAGEKVGLVISRFVTKFILKNYRPTPVDKLAEKMIRVSVDSTSGFRMEKGAAIFSL